MSRPKAITTGVLSFGGVEIDCYNLDDGRRAISQRAIVRALRGAKSGAPNPKGIGDYLARIPDEYAGILARPTSEVEFVLPSGTTSIGRDAEWLIDLCNAYVDAAIAGSLHRKQLHLAAQARTIVAACAKTGIAALIDEATGYQYVREHGILGDIFARALREQASPWKRTWEDATVDAICRTFQIKRVGREFPAPLMGVIGKLYRMLLGSEVHEELRRRNPRGEGRDIHTQWMAEDTVSALRDHLRVIEAFARTCDSKSQFWSRMERYANGGRGQLEMPS